MARYNIPKSAGEFHIQNSLAGTPIVWNNKNGKNKVLIPCRDNKHAKEVLEKIKSLPNGGEIWV